MLGKINTLQVGLSVAVRWTFQLLPLCLFGKKPVLLNGEGRLRVKQGLSHLHISLGNFFVKLT